MPRKFRTILTLAMVLTSASAFDATESITSTPKTTPEVRQVVVPNATSTTTTSPDLPMDNTVTRQDLIASINRSKDFPDGFWDCPNITGASIECSCDFPHTLRCTGDRNSLQIIGQHLRDSPETMISLLDVTMTGMSTLPPNVLDKVNLHGLVISTGELRRVHKSAFTSFSKPLQALGLPNNLLDSVPTTALSQLRGLDRLNLSHNKLVTLKADSFQNLTNLTYLDLCDNLLSQLSPQVFFALPSLHSLKMKGNHLSAAALSALRGLNNLDELDLSSNMLIGPVSMNLLPRMPKLRFLNLAENKLKNVQEGALAGLRNLTYLILSHNQIDVLEDHAFKYLSTLTRLDLANNRIVAVSSSSLAHLEQLETLDLSNNCLRSVSADLVVPLISLKELHLDDNDITMVASDVPMSKLRLTKLSLSDNPLNCDCTLLEFANWLSNSTLDEEDKLSAVCATPPSLENGILTQVSPGNLLCGEPTSSIITKSPLSGTQLTLREFHYSEKSGINLLWNVEPCSERYTCDTLIVYETVGETEIQTDSNPLHCDSRLMRDPCSLAVTIPSSLHLQPGHKYRYCVALLIPSGYDDVLLGLGCSDVIVLKETDKKERKEEHISLNSPKIKIDSLHVNVSDGFMQVEVKLLQPELNEQNLSGTNCDYSIIAYALESQVVHRKRSSCNSSMVTLNGLMPGHYKVCAHVDEINSPERDGSRCVEVHTLKQNTEVFVLVIVATAGILLVTIYLVVRGLMKRIRAPPIQTQCFLPAQEFEITHKAHYIKLLATTKV